MSLKKLDVLVDDNHPFLLKASENDGVGDLGSDPSQKKDDFKLVCTIHEPVYYNIATPCCLCLAIGYSSKAFCKAIWLGYHSKG